MSTLSDFLSQFQSIDEVNATNLEQFLVTISRGGFLRNEKQYRLEFWNKSRRYGWISYEALAPDPERNLASFIKHRLVG